MHFLKKYCGCWLQTGNDRKALLNCRNVEKEPGKNQELHCKLTYLVYTTTVVFSSRCGIKNIKDIRGTH